VVAKLFSRGTLIAFAFAGVLFRPQKCSTEISARRAESRPRLEFADVILGAYDSKTQSRIYPPVLDPYRPIDHRNSYIYS